FSSRRRHTRLQGDWSSDVCSSDLFQGDIDRVVPRAQSDEIVASLKARGVPHEYHVYQGEGHGWRKSETIEQFYTSVDTFLRQYRSEERRVGKECRTRWSTKQLRKK